MESVPDELWSRSATKVDGRMKRPIVCGGRYFTDRAYLFEALDSLRIGHNIFCVIQGGCPTGADMLAREWCFTRQVEYMNYPVSKQDWRTLGRKAGPIRNQRMIDDGEPDGCIAFPGGNGTADMVRRAKAAGLQVITLAPVAKRPSSQQASTPGETPPPSQGQGA